MCFTGSQALSYSHIFFGRGGWDLASFSSQLDSNSFSLCIWHRFHGFSYAASSSWLYQLYRFWTSALLQSRRGHLKTPVNRFVWVCRSLELFMTNLLCTSKVGAQRSSHELGLLFQLWEDSLVEKNGSLNFKWPKCLYLGFIYSAKVLHNKHPLNIELSFADSIHITFNPMRFFAFGRSPPCNRFPIYKILYSFSWWAYAKVMLCDFRQLVFSNHWPTHFYCCDICSRRALEVGVIVTLNLCSLLIVSKGSFGFPRWLGL